MNYFTCLALIVLFTSCNKQKTDNDNISDYDKHLKNESLLYYNRPGYVERMNTLKLPQKASLEDKMLLIAHSFDSHTRLTLGALLWEEIENDKDLIDELVKYLDSDEAYLALTSSWVLEKNGLFAKYADKIRINYQRKDIIDFEKKYH